MGCVAVGAATTQGPLARTDTGNLTSLTDRTRLWRRTAGAALLVVAMVVSATPALATKPISDPRDTRGRFDISAVVANRQTSGGPPGHRSHFYMFSAYTFDRITNPHASVALSDAWLW